MAATLPNGGQGDSISLEIGTAKAYLADEPFVVARGIASRLRLEHCRVLWIEGYAEWPGG